MDIQKKNNYNLDAYAYIGELCEAMLEDQDEDQARIEQLKERERAKRATTLVTLEAIINDNLLWGID